MRKTTIEIEPSDSECLGKTIVDTTVPIFRSPLKDIVAPPNRLSKCSWNRLEDKNQANPHTSTDWKNNSKIYGDILKAIGNTPLVKLNKIPQFYGIRANMYVKCEFMNPGGSVKDRIGLRIIEDAEKQGILKSGYTIIEASSGNTGIGLALAAAVKGYRCIVVMSEKMSHEKTSALKALGAEIIRVPVHLSSFVPDGLFGVTHKLLKEIPNSVVLDQVAGTGTGGTITGLGRKLKELSPQTKIVAADPQCSQMAVPESLNKTDTTFFEVEGIGYDFVPTTLDRNVVDFWIKTSDKETFLMARKLINDEGLFGGGSSGANVVAAIKAAKDLMEGQNVVVILPDETRNYLTKFISDEWMQTRGYIPCENINDHWWWHDRVANLQLPLPQTVCSSTSCVRALNLMRNNGIAQIPILTNDGTFAGILTLQKLLAGLNAKKVDNKDSVEKLIMRVYPKVYNTASLGLVSSILEKETFVVILEKRGNLDYPFGIVTSLDLLIYITQHDTDPTCCSLT